MKLSEEAHRALHLLAKKNNPDYNFGSTIQWTDSIDNWKCLICHKKIGFQSFSYNINNHGTQHLKDNNLLVFL